MSSDLIYWIAIPIAVAALAVIVMVIARHWKEIRLLDPASIKEERLRQKRNQLVEQRFRRMKEDKLAPFRAVTAKGLTSGKKMFHAAYIKLIRLDRLYKQAKAPFAAMAPSVKERVKSLLDEARSLARDLKWADAERRYLEVLSVDNRNVEAYKGLATIYLKQKLHTQARETFEFLVKINKADDAVYDGLGEIAEAEGDAITAEEMYLKALNVQPKLAHRHATLAEFYLEHDEPEKAKPLAEKAMELEPKSAKYLELAVGVAIETGNRTEARRLYDKLRLLSSDNPKLQSLKERIDEIRG